jgi:putative membrane protein
MIAALLTGVVALIHVYIVILEMLWWDTPRGHKAFGLTPEFAARSKVLAANQGLYNGFLSAGLFWSLIASPPDLGVQLKLFFLVCVVVAAIYGAWSVSPRILVVQGGPALLALLFLFLAS